MYNFVLCKKFSVKNRNLTSTTTYYVDVAYLKKIVYITLPGGVDLKGLDFTIFESFKEKEEQVGVNNKNDI